MRLPGFRIAVVAAGLSMLASACGGAAARPADLGRTDERSAAQVRSVLGDAADIARSYGREHLGHYLKLTATKLERAGLEVPADLRLRVTADHTGYCIVVKSEALPASHAWARATTGSTTSGPSPADDCPARSY